MGIHYTYKPEKNYIFVEVFDKIKLDEVLKFIDDVLDDKNIDHPFFEIVDFSNVKTFDFGYKESKTLYDHLKLLVTQKQHKGTCFVTSNDFSVGMTNMFKVVGEQRGINIEIFKSLNDAFEFVNKQHSIN